MSKLQEIINYIKSNNINNKELKELILLFEKYSFINNDQYLNLFSNNRLKYLFSSAEEYNQFIKKTKGTDKRPHFKQLIPTIGSYNEFKLFDSIFPLLLKNKIDYTFKYIFYELKKGIFVKIKNNNLELFLPFTNEHFKNNWGDLLKPPPNYKRGSILAEKIREKKTEIFKARGTKNEDIFRKHLDNLIDLKDSLDKYDDIVAFAYEHEFLKLIKHDLVIDPNVRHWYANNCFFRLSMYSNSEENKQKGLSFKFDEGDKSISNFLHLLGQCCLYEKMPDCCFFINPRDYPIVKKTGEYPYPALTKLSKKPFFSGVDTNELLPIFSQSINDDYNDLIIPNDDDIVNCFNIITSDREPSSDKYITTIFEAKKNKAVFRGKATGCGITEITNKRIQLSFLTKFYDPDLFDVKLTDLNKRLKIDPKNNYCDYINENKELETNNNEKIFIKDLLGNKMTDSETSQYKYIIDIEGHTAAFRFARTLGLHSVVIKIASPWKVWYSDLLIKIDYKTLINTPIDKLDAHYIEIDIKNNVIDIVSLINVIKYLNHSPDVAKKIISNALNFQKKYINKYYMIQYMKNTLLNYFPQKTTEELIEKPIEQTEEEELKNEIQNIIKNENLTVTSTNEEEKKKLIGLITIPNIITEELEKNILKEIYSKEWRSDLKRRVQHYYHVYDYTSKNALVKTDDPGPFVKELEDIVSKFFDCKINQIIVNEYEPGQGISAHIDKPNVFGPVVVTVTLQSDSSMVFSKSGEKDLIVPLIRREAVVLTNDSRYKWTHEIKKNKTDIINGKRKTRGTRVSVTFRCIV